MIKIQFIIIYVGRFGQMQFYMWINRIEQIKYVVGFKLHNIQIIHKTLLSRLHTESKPTYTQYIWSDTSIDYIRIEFRLIVNVWMF